MAMVLVSLLIRAFDLDRKISELSYDQVHQEWPFMRAEPWLSFYRYGIFPPVLVGLVPGLAALCGRRIWPDIALDRLKMLRRDGLFLALMLLIGPGLLVNLGLKEFGGRPRPVQCQEFGGELTFRQVGEWTTHRFPNSSFPSGHASIAFFLIGPAFVIDPSQSRRRWSWFLGGLAYGAAMGFTRVVQGGHFLSDVLWAGILVYLVGVMLARLMLRPKAIDVSQTHGLKVAA